eukprot:490042-Hanusia_phi.AAC.1
MFTTNTNTINFYTDIFTTIIDFEVFKVPQRSQPLQAWQWLQSRLAALKQQDKSRPQAYH